MDVVAALNSFTYRNWRPTGASVEFIERGGRMQWRSKMQCIRCGYGINIDGDGHPDGYAVRNAAPESMARSNYYMQELCFRMDCAHGYEEVSDLMKSLQAFLMQCGARSQLSPEQERIQEERRQSEEYNRSMREMQTRGPPEVYYQDRYPFRVSPEVVENLRIELPLVGKLRMPPMDEPKPKQTKLKEHPSATYKPGKRKL